MMLVEQTGVPAASWPVAAFREHLRLGTGFADDAGQDALLERMLGAAASAVERETGKIMLRRSFLWTLNAWRGARREEFPVAPVTAIAEVRVVDGDGVVSVLSPVSFGLEVDAHRPALAARSMGLPTIPVGGKAEIVFEAGLSAEWDSLPADLSQAVFLLGAHYHENRHAVTEGQPIPAGIATLLAPWRPMRLFGRRL